MKRLFEALKSVLNQGGDAVLVTVAASSGSTPRGAGARMLVTGAGRIYGTIGGGGVEHYAEQLALEVLAAKRSRMERFLLRKNQVQDLGMVCGGDVTVYFQYLSAKDKTLSSIAEHALELFRQGEESWLIDDITPGGTGGLFLYGKAQGVAEGALPREVLEQIGTAPKQVEAGGRCYLVEPLLRGGIVYIFGGGHVAQALVPVLSAVDFRCWVLEDREDFCRPSQFPGVERTLLLRTAEDWDGLSIGKEDYVCIMTRGHKDDLICEAFALKTSARYIGVIGSRKKTAVVNARLREMGFDDRALERITTPIGLDIGAQTPAEIAVSIAAQLIQVRAKDQPQK